MTTRRDAPVELAESNGTRWPNVSSAAYQRALAEGYRRAWADTSDPWGMSLPSGVHRRAESYALDLMGKAQADRVAA